MKNFKLGQKTKDIWCGDMVVECEYLGELGEGRMLFYDTTTKAFRLVYPELCEGEYLLNGWKAASKPSQLIR